MAAPELRALVTDRQENATNPAPLGPLVEALAARVADLEAQMGVVRSAVRTMSLENDVANDMVRQRLGQARNVEQRCKELLEKMRALLAKHT